MELESFGEKTRLVERHREETSGNGQLGDIDK